MSDPLPIIKTKNFNNALKKIPQKEQTKIIYNLSLITRQDAFRVGYLHGDMNHFKKYRLGDYRILMAYCYDCFENGHYNKLKCSVCDEENLERIILFHVFQRKKGYRPYKMKLKEIEF